MTADEQEEVYGEAAELSEEYIALTEEEQEQLDITLMVALFAVINEGIETYEGPVTFRNSGYPYGKIMSSSGITFVIEVEESGASYQWQVADSKDGTFSNIWCD